jgi:hypothetical protein
MYVASLIAAEVVAEWQRVEIWQRELARLQTTLDVVASADAPDATMSSKSAIPAEDRLLPKRTSKSGSEQLRASVDLFPSSVNSNGN